jgi:hypothetical protein
LQLLLKQLANYCKVWSVKLPIILVVAAIALPLPSASNAIARGGALPWLSSPGYERALMESRRKLKQDLQQQNKPVVVRRKKK